MLAIALVVPVAWLLGTFPSALLVARAHGRDVLREGSGNPGASNVARLLGWKAGALVLLLDFAKGAAAAGALVVLYPLVVVGLAVCWVLVARVLHKASLASLLATILFPIAVLLLGYDRWEVGVVGGLAVLVVARHAGNIRRLLHREEHDLGAGRRSEEAA